ncbi:hypothetical protein WJX72_002478 [[Myrmecia] bisecta]|uniref:Disease resistance R13L4/SHOC-2-like LRR domain-containing protein n=1 Tax=[Myrmecia] bisecta TaxID=41462 RepID=A0AAW1QEG2_9CHLO
MGNCCGSTSNGQTQQANNVRKNAQQREAAWAATGTISLRDSNIKELPSSVQQVGASARILDASNSKLASLPEFIVALVNLQRLIVANNQLRSLPNQLTTLRNLKILNVDANQLSCLPEDMGSLTKLEKLSAAGNVLTALPPSIGQLKVLKQLNVSANKLSELPASLGHVDQLEELDATDNYLQSIPETLGKLQRLKTMTLNKNRIGSVPAPIFLQCAALQTLSLHSNPITIEVLQATEGYQAFDERRRSKFNKAIATGVLLGSGGLDEGVDRQTTRPAAFSVAQPS